MYMEVVWGGEQPDFWLAYSADAGILLIIKAKPVVHCALPILCLQFITSVHFHGISLATSLPTSSICGQSSVSVAIWMLLVFAFCLG